VPQTRQIAAIAVSAALLAAGLAVPAGASAGSGGDVVPQTTGYASVSVSGVPPGEVEKLLSEVPLGASGVPLGDLEVPQLAKLLAELKGLSGLSGLTGLGGTTGLEQVLRTAIDQLVAGNGKLGELLNPAVLAPKLESALSGLLGPLLGPELKTLVETLLKESPLAVITEGLGSVNLNELTSSLLKEAENPAQLVDQLLAAANPQELQALLGTTLTPEEPFSLSTVGGLASGIGTTAEGLADDLHTTTSQLPATAMALTAPLTDGNTLAVLDAVKGLDLGLLSSTLTEEKTSEGSGGSGSGESGGSSGGSGSGSSSGGSGESGSGSGGGAAGSGGTGGAGSPGGGSSGTPTGTTLIVNLPSAQGPPAVTSSGTTAARVKIKIKILRRKVRGDAVTLVVWVPAAGRLTVAGKGWKSASRETGKAERVALRAVLTRAGVASLHRHHHRLKVKLEVSFKPARGPGSSATTTVACAFH
jgi:hypothetical protein